MKVPENLIHIDINAEVFNKNFPAKVTIEGDAKRVLTAVVDLLGKEEQRTARSFHDVAEFIYREKEKYEAEWN